jgi:hypothetical protein
MNTKNLRKDLNEKGSKEEMEASTPERDCALTCLLPTTNRKLRLSIIIKKEPKAKMRRVTGTTEKPKEREKEVVKNVSLLDTLLQVVELYKADV